MADQPFPARAWIHKDDDCKSGAPASVWNRRAEDVPPDWLGEALNSGNGSYRP